MPSLTPSITPLSHSKTYGQLCASLQSALGPIRRELERATSLASSPVAHPDATNEMHPGGTWSWEPLFGVGGWNALAMARFPLTTATIAALDTSVCTNFGFAFFSRLGTRTHLRRHTGSSNLRARIHLTLTSPDVEGMWLVVGNKTQHWREGECFVFNDAYAHEVAFDPQSAKRTPAAVRTVLVVDVWHEGLTAAERAILGLDVFGRFGRS